MLEIETEKDLNILQTYKHRKSIFQTTINHSHIIHIFLNHKLIHGNKHDMFVIHTKFTLEVM